MISLNLILETLLNEDKESIRVIDSTLRNAKYNPLSRVEYDNLAGQYTDPDASEDEKDRILQTIKERSYRTIWHLAKKFGNLGDESTAPDLFQEGIIYLNKLANIWNFSDPTATFNTFVTLSMRNHFNNISSKERKQKKGFISVNQVGGEDEEGNSRSILDTNPNLATPVFDLDLLKDADVYTDKIKKYIRSLPDGPIKQLASLLFTISTNDKYQKVKITVADIANGLDKSPEWTRKQKIALEDKFKEIILGK